MSITGRRWTRKLTHPTWCDALRCEAGLTGAIGGHRSPPMVAQVPEFGRIIMTLVQYQQRQPALEVTVSATVPDAPAEQQRLYAEQVLEQLANTAQRVALFARVDSPPRRPAIAGHH
ncbi:hypothetical protein OHQ88_34180 (plasmid) [Micromonospora zamorensis]|uniref:hypothetical protein n=1 Tax=Micromonospora zamorensis TaxID=709883 RepID=UPI002E22568B